jgi:hypothetical protein
VILWFVPKKAINIKITNHNSSVNLLWLLNFIFPEKKLVNCMTSNKPTFQQNKSKVNHFNFIDNWKYSWIKKKRLTKIRKKYLFKENRLNPVLSNKSNCHYRTNRVMIRQPYKKSLILLILYEFIAVSKLVQNPSESLLFIITALAFCETNHF